MTNQTLGSRLKTHREQFQLTQTTLAQHLHVSRQTVSSWETDRNQPDITTIQELATFYAVSVDDLLDTQYPLSDNPSILSIKLSRVLLAILLMERLTQLSTFPGLYWMDSLICWILILCLFVHLENRRPQPWLRYIYWGGLILFSICTFTSGTLNLWQMGFGLATTCQACGLLVLGNSVYHLCLRLKH